jgi:hypothetical protein
VARGDAAMDVLPGLVVLLAAAMTSWFSSMVTSSWSRVKPATASVMRRRSGWPLDRSHRSMLYGRIAVSALHDAIERTLDFVESKQKRDWRAKEHVTLQSPLEATLTPWALAAPSAHARGRLIRRRTAQYGVGGVGFKRGCVNRRIGGRLECTRFRPYAVKKCSLSRGAPPDPLAMRAQRAGDRTITARRQFAGVGGDGLRLVLRVRNKGLGADLLDRLHGEVERKAAATHSRG